MGLNAGTQRQNGPVAHLKINKRKWLTLTDKCKTVTNYGGKCLFGLSDFNTIQMATEIFALPISENKSKV